MKPQAFWRWVIAAAIVFTVLELADGFIASPLRLWSSTIAAAVLRLANYSIEQHGTILTTTRFSFDVVPACSGSTTLRVLLALSLIWIGQLPHLSLFRRSLVMICATGIAVLSNGVRVAILVALGDQRMAPIEGFPHALIGLCTFAVALGSVIALADVMSNSVAPATTTSRKPIPIALITLIVSILLLALPGLMWISNAWITSPLDRWGWLFWIAAGMCWWCTRTIQSTPHLGLTATALSLGGGLIMVGSLVDISSLHAIGMSMLILGLLTLSGVKTLIFQLPIGILLILGFPIVGFLLSRITGWDGQAASLTLKSIIGTLAIFSQVILTKAYNRKVGFSLSSDPTTHPASQTTSDLRLLPLLPIPLIALCAHVMITTQRESMAPLSIATPYLHGDWVGDDIPIHDTTLKIIGSDNVLHRRYANESHLETAQVELLITRTGGDRHRAHPPEYCLTGAGWVIDSTQDISITLGNGTSLSVRELGLSNGTQSCTFMSWFTDGDITVPTFASMLADDTLRRLKGQRTDWALLRVFSTDKDAAHAFLHQFTGMVAPTTTKQEAYP